MGEAKGLAGGPRGPLGARREEGVVRPQLRRGRRPLLLMLDNFLASHGREPCEGPRRILVAMAELYTNPEIGNASG